MFAVFIITVCSGKRSPRCGVRTLGTEALRQALSQPGECRAHSTELAISPGLSLPLQLLLSGGTLRNERCPRVCLFHALGCGVGILAAFAGFHQPAWGSIMVSTLIVVHRCVSYLARARVFSW